MPQWWYCQDAPPDMLKDEFPVEDLRQRLHDRIDRLPISKLPAADRLLLKVEVETLRQELDSAFDQDRADSKISPEKAEKAIALHRARHPYR
ncbi:MAG: hypothetical protein C5B50_03295 [Verrucomicrobia bacterium]|nr:MAG: hypothetical protein C5B50_03295 [Verrucomicrobiota bacterium]